MWTLHAFDISIVTEDLFKAAGVLASVYFLLLTIRFDTGS